MHDFGKWKNYISFWRKSNLFYFIIGFALLLIVAICLLDATKADWSWGSSDKKTTDEVADEKPKIETEPEGRVLNKNIQPREKIAIPSDILPLEEHSPSPSHLPQQQQFAPLQQQEHEAPLLEGGEEGRDARFLNIPNKLCKLGVKGMVS